MPQPEARVGVIGGTGLYQIEGLTEVKEVDIDTPFGKPSDTLISRRLGIPKGFGLLGLRRCATFASRNRVAVASRAWRRNA